MWGEDEYKQKERELMNRLELLKPTPEEEKQQVYHTSWSFLKMKRRG